MFWSRLYWKPPLPQAYVHARLDKAHGVHMHSPSIHYTGWSALIICCPVAFTHTSNESHTLKPVQRETIFRVWELFFVNSPSFSWMTHPVEAPEQRPGRVRRTTSGMQSDVWRPGEALNGTAQGLQSKQSPNENRCTGFTSFSLDSRAHVVAAFSSDHGPLRVDSGVILIRLYARELFTCQINGTKLHVRFS